MAIVLLSNSVKETGFGMLHALLSSVARLWATAARLALPGWQPCYAQQAGRPLTPGKVAGCRGVQMGPGATAFTRMPLDTSWLLSARVKAICEIVAAAAAADTHSVDTVAN
jgi:hypothetical protein